MATATADPSVGNFLSFLLNEKGCSQSTIDAYGNDLEQFGLFFSHVQILKSPFSRTLPREWNLVTRDIIEQFVVDLNQQRYAEASIARKVAAVKSFFQFLEAEGSVPTNPTEDLQSPRVSKILPNPLSIREVALLLEQPAKKQTPGALRDRAMMELLYATGLRVTELVELDLESVSTALKNPGVQCSGAGSKDRFVPIHEQALKALLDYLENGRPKLVKGGSARALFLNYRGDRLTRVGFWLILKQYAEQAGIEGVVSPHSLRHSFAAHMLRGGAPVQRVQELMGHANVSTTQVYTQILDDHARQVYDRAHPRARVRAS